MFLEAPAYGWLVREAATGAAGADWTLNSTEAVWSHEASTIFDPAAAASRVGRVG